MSITEAQQKFLEPLQLAAERGDDPHIAIINIAVQLYVSEMEDMKDRLLKQVSHEEGKNLLVKSLAEKLAHRLLEIEPENELAKETLGVLLEGKMMGHVVKRRKKQ